MAENELPTIYRVIRSEHLHMIEYVETHILEISRSDFNAPDVDIIAKYSHNGTTSYVWNDTDWVSCDVDVKRILNSYDFTCASRPPQRLAKDCLIQSMMLSYVINVIYDDDQDKRVIIICKSEMNDETFEDETQNSY